jgi:hypothetical protein
MVRSAMALPKAMAANKFAILAAVACAGLMITYAGAAATSRDAGGFEASELYPTKPGGREWFLNATEPRDGLLMISPAAALLYGRPDGSWEIGWETGSREAGLRMYVISPDGWRDVEMTGYVKLESFSFDEEFAWAVRSGQHTASNPCEGTAYYGALSFAGEATFQKEVAHFDGGYTDKRRSSMTVEPLEDRWVGIKMAAYNVEQGVKLELWVDDRADNNWIKIAETTDDGGWSSREGFCGRDSDHVISEPRPRVTFRVDNATFEFRDLSVREITLEPQEPKCYFGAFPICL